jgi:hypothetical protein
MQLCYNYPCMKNYGTIIPHLMINNKPAPYPVVNEREIRGAAGIMFLIGIITFAIVFFTQNFLPLYIVVPIFWVDFFVKTVFQPHYSIFGWIAKFFVHNQTPDYVGAIQKRFAWGIGLFLATLMLVLAIILGVRGWPLFAICSVCLFFMWLESAFGICVGCTIYSWLVKKKIITEPEYKPACAGGVCEID